CPLSDNCPIAVLLVSDMPETLFSAYTTPSTRPLITAQPQPPRILLPYRQIFNKLWVRHTRRHSPRILANPRSRNRRKPRASLIWPKTGSTITFRREYTARPAAVFSFACIFALAVAGRRSRLRRRGGGRTVVPLPLRRDVRIETLTLQRLHRGPTEVARIQRRRDQRPLSGLIRSQCNPGLVQLATGGLRHRLGLLLVVALRRHLARQDDLAAVIDTGLGVATAIPTLVGGLHDRP